MEVTPFIPLILRGIGETLIFQRKLVGKHRTTTILEKLSCYYVGSGIAHFYPVSFRTPAPRIFPSLSRISASLASSNLNSRVSGTMGIWAAKGRNS